MSRPRHKVENRREETERQDPDCCTCYQRKTCPRYAENSFCGQWASREPEERKPDPNRLWETGEEVEI